MILSSFKSSWHRLLTVLIQTAMLIQPDDESAAFFDAMKNQGFEYLLSSEDTGTGDQIHSSGTSTEWWGTFFKPSRVSPANDIPSGFLADDRSNHDDYERVPGAFALD